jgi:hypothetical protein
MVAYGVYSEELSLDPPQGFAPSLIGQPVLTRNPCSPSFKDMPVLYA